MVGRIYKVDHYTIVTLLHTKYESSRPSRFGEDFFLFSHDARRGGACMDPRGTVGRIYKEDHHCYTQNMKALDLVVSEKKIFLLCFPIVSVWKLSVALKTRVLILAQNLMQHFPILNDKI